MSYLLADEDNSKHVYGYEALVQGLQRVREYLASAGLSLPGGSRLKRYDDTLRLLKQPLTEKTKAVHAAALVPELEQLITIVDELRDQTDLPDRLRGIFGGQTDILVMPDRDPARDFQFELFLASALKPLGSALQLAEPDVLINLGGRRIAFAAKRPKRPTAIKSLVRKGIEQIVGCGHDGFVAIDLSLCPIEGKLFVAMVEKPNEVVGAAKHFLAEFLRQHHANLNSVCRSAPATLLGLLFFLSVPVHVKAPWGGAAGHSWAVLAHGRNNLQFAAELLAGLDRGEIQRAQRAGLVDAEGTLAPPGQLSWIAVPPIPQGPPPPQDE